MRAPSAPALALVALLAATALSGCITSSEVVPASLVPRPAYDTSRAWSMPLTPALYEILEGVQEMVPSFDGTPIALGIFLPAIEGCDWAAESLPDTCRLPVVMDAGPYYGDHVEVDKYRPPLIEWLVPRGYAVVQMAIRGTGESGGCMELFSMNEQKDVDAMVTWLAERPWSNGNVGMMGRSYDGTTPLMAAALGNPHLKTIVPISSVTDLTQLMFKNGTSEFRGPIFHNIVYWFFYGLGAVDGGIVGYRTEHIPEQVCQAVVDGTVDPALTTLTGDASGPYFQERIFQQRILENYKGSVWIVHGFEDWNVNPSQVVPFYQQLQDAGIEAKMWLGVWGHAYPDRVDEHRNVRWDWAEQTVQWFDHYLKGEGPKPRLDVEVEDSLYVWRSEPTYPPRDAVMRDFELSADGALAPRGEGSDGTFALALGTTAPVLGQITGVGPVGPAGDHAAFTSEPLERDLRIAGLPQLHVEVAPTTPDGGYLFAELYDVYPDGRSVRIGWGAIDVAHHAGGNGAPATLTPGSPVTAMLEFEPMDAHVGQGHRLMVVLHKDGVEDILPSPSPEALLLGLGGERSVLRLPEVERPSILPTYAPPRVAG